MDFRREWIDRSGGEASVVSDQALHFMQRVVAKRMEDGKNGSHEPHSVKLHSYCMTTTGITMVIRMDRFGKYIREKCALGTSGLPGLRYFCETRRTIILDCVYKHGGDVTQFFDFDDLIVCSFSRADQYRVTSSNDSCIAATDSHVQHYADYQNALLCAKALEQMDTKLGDFDNSGKDIYIKVSISYNLQRVLCMGGYRSKRASPKITDISSKVPYMDEDKDEWENRVFVSITDFKHNVCSYFGAIDGLQSSSVVVEKSCYELFQHLSGDNLTVTITQNGNYLVGGVSFLTDHGNSLSSESSPVEVKTETLEMIELLQSEDSIRSNRQKSTLDGIISRLAPSAIKLYEFQFHLTVSMFMRFKVPKLADTTSSSSSDGAIDVERLQVSCIICLI